MKYKKKYKTKTLGQKKATLFVIIKSIAKNKFIRHFFTVIVIASFVGVLLGTLLLQLFVEETKDEIPKDSSPVATLEKKDVHKEKEKYKVNSLQIYVVQAGVFEGKENAIHYAAEFHDSTAVVVHEKEGLHYVLINVATTADRAKAFIEDRLDKGRDAIVKQWVVNEKENTNMEQEEMIFVNDLQHIWKQTLEQLEQREAISLQHWLRFLEKNKSLQEREFELTIKINEEVQNRVGMEAERKEMEQFLLNILVMYDEFLHKQ